VSGIVPHLVSFTHHHNPRSQLALSHIVEEERGSEIKKKNHLLKIMKLRIQTQAWLTPKPSSFQTQHYLLLLQTLKMSGLKG
jgi:hypothetical protein